MYLDLAYVTSGLWRMWLVDPSIDEVYRRNSPSVIWLSIDPIRSIIPPVDPGRSEPNDSFVAVDWQHGSRVAWEQDSINPGWIGLFSFSFIRLNSVCGIPGVSPYTNTLGISMGWMKIYDRATRSKYHRLLSLTIWGLGNSGNELRYDYELHDTVTESCRR